MAGPASDHHRGDMDITEQQATFRLVMGMTKWGSLYIAALVLFLTMLFGTEAGFMGSAVATLVLIVVGTLLLRERRSSGH